MIREIYKNPKICTSKNYADFREKPVFMAPGKRYHVPMKRIFVLTCCLILAGQFAGASEFRFSSRPNKAGLVQWRTWGPQVLEEARKKDRLILLSLSAVWCHWCHVMDETTYSDGAVIDFINEHFIPVRVDADMRPDIDSLYNQGGWPSTAILTPQGEVISGGTYIPPGEMLARLKRASALYGSDRKTIASRIEDMKVAQELRDLESRTISAQPGKGDLESIVQLIKSSFDEKNGGFGTGQKFPSPETVDFLLSVFAKDRDPGIGKIITITLDRMGKGEIFDDREGGFFRYSTGPDWSGPHYEKLLEVNAGLIRNYAEASQVFGSKEYERIAGQCLHYIESTLYDPESGAFFGSQDADEDYYLAGDRAHRKAPLVDRTAYADSSSLMVSALIAAYGAAGNRHYLEMAQRGTEFILQNLYGGSDAGVYHFYREKTKHVPGLLSDNVLFGSALLDLYHATGDRPYLNGAQEIGRLVAARFYDGGARRFRTSLDASPAKPVTAGILSDVNGSLANYRALRFLGRLSYGDEPRAFKEIRDALAVSLSGGYRRFSPYAAAYGNALLWVLYDPVRITVIADAAAWRDYGEAVESIYIPEKVVTFLSLSHDAGQIRKLNYSNKEAVYLCAGKRCSKPIEGSGRLKKEIRDFVGKQSATDRKE
jgi:uncharacterized protein YyaL (SSP411 family)